MGNTDTRTVYKNFNLQQLNRNGMDPSQLEYQKYLEQNYFVPPHDDDPFFSHYMSHVIPNAPGAVFDRGGFNLFPLSLTDVVKSNTSSLGRRPKKIATKKGGFKTFSLFFQEL